MITITFDALDMKKGMTLDEMSDRISAIKDQGVEGSQPLEVRVNFRGKVTRVVGKSEETK